MCWTGACAPYWGSQTSIKPKVTWNERLQIHLWKVMQGHTMMFSFQRDLFGTWHCTARRLDRGHLWSNILKKQWRTSDLNARSARTKKSQPQKGEWQTQALRHRGNCKSQCRTLSGNIKTDYTSARRWHTHQNLYNRYATETCAWRFLFGLKWSLTCMRWLELESGVEWRL